MRVGGDRTDMDRILRASLGRRDVLKYGGIAALAACRHGRRSPADGEAAVRRALPETPSSTRRSRRSPAACRSSTGRATATATYYPKEEKQFLWRPVQDGDRRHPEFILFENDDAGYTEVAAGARYDVVHPCGYKYKDWVDLEVVQPWDTSLIPNFSPLNPKLMASGVVDGQQYFIPLDWGFIAPLVNLDHVDVQEESFGILFDDRYEGKISWVDTLEHDVRRRHVPRGRRPLRHDRRGARRGARLPDLEEAPRELLLEPVLRLLAGLQDGRRSGSGTRGPTRSATPTRPG